MKKIILFSTVLFSMSAFSKTQDLRVRFSSGISRPGTIELVNLDKGTTLLVKSFDKDCVYNAKVELDSKGNEIMILEKTADCPGFPQDRGL